MPISVKDIGDIKGKRVLLRMSLNVPLEEGKVVDTYRVDHGIKTLQFLKDQGAHVIAVSHIGRDPKETLRPVADYINTKTEIAFISNVYEEGLLEKTKDMPEGSALLIENLRSVLGEKDNDPEFVKYLASLADVYVNDAFAESHRAHASVAGVPTILSGYMGFQLEDEIKHLSMALNPAHPFLFMLGGAKFETKIPLMEKFLELADTVFVGGALANDFYKLKGYEIGKSRADDVKADLSHMLASPKLVIPRDVRVKHGEETFVRKADEVQADDAIMDSGPETTDDLRARIKEAKFILWNGPFGDYEEGFAEATEDVLRALAECDAATIVGGGDTVALVTELGIADKLTFVSTGGGAMLDYLADGYLVGINALESSPKQT